MSTDDAKAITDAIALLDQQGVVQIAEHTFIFDRTSHQNWIDQNVRGSARSIGEFIHTQGWTKNERRSVVNQRTNDAIVTEMMVIDPRQIRKAVEALKAVPK